MQTGQGHPLKSVKDITIVRGRGKQTIYGSASSSNGAKAFLSQYLLNPTKIKPVDKRIDILFLLNGCTQSLLDCGDTNLAMTANHQAIELLERNGLDQYKPETVEQTYLYRIKFLTAERNFRAIQDILKQLAAKPDLIKKLNQTIIEHSKTSQKSPVDIDAKASTDAAASTVIKVDPPISGATTDEVAQETKVSQSPSAVKKRRPAKGKKNISILGVPKENLTEVSFNIIQSYMSQKVSPAQMLGQVENLLFLSKQLKEKHCYEDELMVIEKAISYYEIVNEIKDETVVSTAPGKDIYLAYAFLLIRFNKFEQAEKIRQRVPQEDPEQINLDLFHFTKRIDLETKLGHKELVNHYGHKLLQVGWKLYNQGNMKGAYSCFLSLTLRQYHENSASLFDKTIPIGRMLLAASPERANIFFGVLITYGNNSLEKGDIGEAQAIARAIFACPHGNFHDFFQQLGNVMIARGMVEGVRELYGNILSMSLESVDEESLDKLNALKIEVVKMLRFQNADANKEAKVSVRDRGIKSVTEALVTLRGRSQTPPRVRPVATLPVVQAHNLRRVSLG